MKHIVLSLLLLIPFAFTRAQNVVYDENAEVRQVAPFTSIEVSGAVFLYLSQGPTQGVAISAGDAKYNAKIKTTVTAGVLHITVDGGVWNGFNWTNKKLKAYVTATQLERLEVSGASYVSINGAINGENLKLAVSGASEVKGLVAVNNLNLDFSGASVARLSGSAKQASIDASGACKINAYDLAVNNCKVSSSGASNIRITVNGELNADASGGSVVYYKGPGSAKTLNASGGARIKNRGDSDD